MTGGGPVWWCEEPSSSGGRCQHQLSSLCGSKIVLIPSEEAESSLDWCSESESCFVSILTLQLRPIMNGNTKSRAAFRENYLTFNNDKLSDWLGWSKLCCCCIPPQSNGLRRKLDNLNSSQYTTWTLIQCLTLQIRQEGTLYYSWCKLI